MLVNYDKFPGRKLALTSVDAEKAFDNLNWELLIITLEEMNFGLIFVNAIKGIYKEQKSYLIVNEVKSERFKLWKGTRQGCPLSPLLFILVLEVMLRRIRQNKDIVGLKLGKYENKYRAYADDVMFISEDPIHILPELLKEVNQFGELVGFKTNYKKTNIICKNMTRKEEEELQLKIKCEVMRKVKYLGIFITKKNTELYKNNYEVVIEEIKRKLQIWNKLNLSLLGRIAMIKMMVLPKMPFLFMTLLILNKLDLLDRWQKILVNFIWAGKKA